jgi:hypothetical protein
MGKGYNQLSRNPNICPSCSSLIDGMEEEVGSGLPHEDSGISIESHEDRSASAVGHES